MKDRIETIDSFRCLAVMGVVFYHFYARFSPPISGVNHLPYTYSNFFLINYGHFGVQFFFVISGFVIAHTLLKCSSYMEFMVKRLFRLLPALVVCSVISFLIQTRMHHNVSILSYAQWIDFLPGFTFLPPAFWSCIIGDDVKYIDGAYWSLFVEMSFYVVAGLIYFFSPRSFSFNWIFLTVCLIAIRFIISPKLQPFLPESLNHFNATLYKFYLTLHLSYWSYFSIGIFFYSWFRLQVKKTELAMIIFVAVAELYLLHDPILRLLFVVILLLFICLIVRPNWLAFLNQRWVLWIGSISYPLYLLHQNIGLILINEFAVITSTDTKWILPPLVLLVVLVIAEAVNRFFEKPIAKLKGRLQVIW